MRSSTWWNSSSISAALKPICTQLDLADITLLLSPLICLQLAQVHSHLERSNGFPGWSYKKVWSYSNISTRAISQALLESCRKNRADDLADSIPVLPAWRMQPTTCHHMFGAKLGSREARMMQRIQVIFFPLNKEQGALKLASSTYVLCHSFPKHYFRELATGVFLLNTLEDLVSKKGLCSMVALDILPLWICSHLF